jgi:hypothetical protein
MEVSGVQLDVTTIIIIAIVVLLAMMVFGWVMKSLRWLIRVAFWLAVLLVLGMVILWVLGGL